MVDADAQCLEESTVIQLAQGMLDAPALARAESHLAHCEPCRALLVLAIRTADQALHQGSTLRSRGQPPVDSTDALELGASAQPAALDAGELEVPQPGTILVDKYRVEGVLGRGGMGVVLAATHLVLHSRVAIKVLRRAGPGEIARFLREARVSAQLRNRHIVRVFDFGQLPSGAPFLVMEYLEGKDLAQCIESAPLPVHSVVEYVAQACDALAQVHALGIVHRDLKPANLFLTQDHGELLIKVLDFGIFKTLAGASFHVGGGSTQLTGAHALIGSPVYMSPEQLLAREIDARSDIWALGVILYELLTRQLPFGERNLSALAVAVATSEPTPPSQLQAGIPRALEAIILRCLRKDPAERFRDAAALLVALVPLRTASTNGDAPRKPGTSSRRLALSGALAVLAAALAWWTTASSVSPGRPSSVQSAAPAAPRPLSASAPTTGALRPLGAPPSEPPPGDTAGGPGSSDAGSAAPAPLPASSAPPSTNSESAEGVSTPRSARPGRTEQRPDPASRRSHAGQPRALNARERQRARTRKVDGDGSQGPGLGPTDTPD